MSAPPLVSNSGEVPTYPWFQEQNASKVSKDSLIEMNHIAEKNQQDRSVISFGNQNRTDKVGFSVREAVERNGNLAGTTIEKLAAEERITTLMSEGNARAQMSKDFSNVFLTAKDIQIAGADDIGKVQVSALEESLRSQAETQGEGNLLRNKVEKLALQQACETGHIMTQETAQLGDLKNHATLEFSLTEERLEHDFGRAELEVLKAVKHLEKNAGFLGIQSEQHQGDTNRRMANYRSGVDGRLDSFGAALALEFATIRNSLAVQAADNTSRLEECCCETKVVIGEQAGVSDNLLRALERGQLRDGLAAQEQANLLSQIDRKHC